MFRQVIDPETGAILLDDGYSLCTDKSEADVAAHFGMALKPEQEWGGVHYSLESIAIGGWKLYMNLTFFHNKLQTISLYPIIPAELLRPLDAERKGFGPSEQEYAELDFYENWLNEQFQEQRKFDWGKIEALFAPRQDGPGEPLIHLVYK
jgi:hypothetical protein